MYREDEPSAMFHTLHRAHKKQVSEAQSARGLEDLGSPMLLMALLKAKQRGVEYSQRELARAMRLSPATVAVSLKSLERAGYVERRVDEHDARRNLVALTPHGEAAVDLLGEAFHSVDEQMLSGFSSEEREVLSQFFRRMLSNLGGAPVCPPDCPYAPPDP